MKVITIKQPWATLIAKGYKEYEFRTWKTKYRGDILIHAGKSIDKKAISRFENLNLEYPKGCIIAKAKITDCIYVDDKFRKEVIPKNPEVYRGLVTKDDWEGYGFKIEDVKEIEPIQINGKLSLWDYDYKELLVYNEINNKYGKLDGLVNSAGIIKLGGIEDQSLEEWNIFNNKIMLSND